MRVRNYLSLTSRLATSGQPTEEQFAQIAAEGYEVVMNLALPTSTYALPDERATVTSLGMEYVALPVDFYQPQVADVARFFDLMVEYAPRKLWIHCVVNMRVSAFVYLWRTLRCGVAPDEAEIELHDIWVPEKEAPQWYQLIQDATRELFQ
jgi:protein tyrosine phosphatase (PTP) superfamily phosphohydrolase (DUF442 family)